MNGKRKGKNGKRKERTTWEVVEVANTATVVHRLFSLKI